MAKQEINYSKLKSRLDEILNELSSPDYDIDKAIEKYKEAQLILEKLESYLKTAENKIIGLNKKSK